MSAFVDPEPTPADLQTVGPAAREEELNRLLALAEIRIEELESALAEERNERDA